MRETSSENTEQFAHESQGPPLMLGQPQEGGKAGRKAEC